MRKCCLTTKVRSLDLKVYIHLNPQLITQEYQLKLIVFDPVNEEIIQWEN